MTAFAHRQIALLAAALAVLLVLALPGAAHAGRAPGESVPLSDYWQIIRSARTAVAQARKLDGAERRAKLAEAATLLESVEAVVLADGSVVPVDNRALVAGLRADEPDLARLESALAALRDAGASGSLPDPPADAEARLAEIMARREFQYVTQTPSPLGQLWSRFWAWLLGVILSLAALLLSPVVVAVAALVLAMVVLLVLYSARGLVVQTQLQERLAPGDDALSSTQALQRAQGQAAAGDYRSAVRYLYLSTLLFLEEAGRLRYDRALTNREYLRQLESQSDLIEPFRAVVTTFDRVWYGFAPLDAPAYEAFARQVQSLRQVKIA